MATTTFQIRGRAKVRSLAIAAGVSEVGIVLMGLVALLQLDSVWLTVGLVLAGVGIGMVLVTQDTARKSSVMARLDEKGFALVSSRTRFGLAWTDVKRVSMVGRELIIRDNKGQDAKVIAPPGSKPEELDNLAAAMAEHLDQSRGYRGGRKG